VAAEPNQILSNSLPDQWGRIASKLRISVTDRCNLRCQYCMPAEGLQWQPRSQILNFEEILRLMRIFVQLGIRQVRLTGGEPLLRKELHKLVAAMQELPLDKISMTSNGILLPQSMPELYKAGLRSLNISLDSLISERFETITRRDDYERVKAGLAHLEQYPDLEIKLNVVVMRGFNEDEALAFAGFAREKGWNIRFIEFMPLGKDDGWLPQEVVPGAELRAQIETRYPLIAVESAGANPAARWRFADGAPGEIGLINSVSEPFCQNCNRIRLTADGQLRNCLFSNQECDLKTPLRSGASETELAEIIRAWVWNKEAGHQINQVGFERPLRSMSQIGG
jgi:GTP 3',8-cyclase